MPQGGVIFLCDPRTEAECLQRGLFGLPATQTALFNPTDVAFEANGNMVIADMRNNRVRVLDVGEHLFGRRIDDLHAHIRSNPRNSSQSVTAAAVQVVGGVALSPLLVGLTQQAKARLQGRRGAGPCEALRTLSRTWELWIPRFFGISRMLPYRRS